MKNKYKNFKPNRQPDFTGSDLDLNGEQSKGLYKVMHTLNNLISEIHGQAEYGDQCNLRMLEDSVHILEETLNKIGYIR